VEQLVPIREVAQVLGLSVSWVEKAVVKHGLPSYKIGGSRKFRLSEVETWLAEHREGAP
jgi:excisionase family DNA binding protein